jgi:hypothetical protein
MTTSFRTFKFYDSKKRRLSIFAEIAGDTIEVIVIPCARKDTFSKKVSKDLYKKITVDLIDFKGVTTTNIGIKDNNPKATFFEWCRKNYLQKFYFQVARKQYYLSSKPVMAICLPGKEQRRKAIFIKN